MQDNPPAHRPESGTSIVRRDDPRPEPIAGAHAGSETYPSPGIYVSGSPHVSGIHSSGYGSSLASHRSPLPSPNRSYAQHPKGAQDTCLSEEEHPYTKKPPYQSEPDPEPSIQSTAPRHVTTLNFTPMPPYLREAEPLASGRHLTSLNLQLSPPSSDQPPIEITTVPVTHDGSPSSSSEFNSHVRISFSPSGTSVTAMRTVPRRTHAVPANLHPQEHLQRYSGTEGHKEDAGKFVRRGRGGREVMHPADDPCYLEAFLAYQREKLELLQQEVSQRERELHLRRLRVSALEEQALTRAGTAQALVETVQRMREEILQLRIECCILALNVDIWGRGEVPLGITDEDFYKNIPTGPVDHRVHYHQAPGAGGHSDIENAGDQGAASSSHQLAEATESEQSHDDEEDGDRWKCSQCTFLNHPAMDTCEICETPRIIVDSVSIGDAQHDG